MASNSFKVKNSINIEPKTSPTLDTVGDVGYNSTAGEFEIRDASATRSLVTDDGSQVLTNKTISGASNTLSNIPSSATTLATETSVSIATSNTASTINIGNGTDTNTINIGGANTTVNITGTVNNQNVTNLNVTDKLITINDGGGAGSGSVAGIEIEENAVATGYAYTSADRNSWEFKAPNTNGVTSLTPGASADTIALLAASQALTNKTINGSSNTITNVSLTTGVTGVLPIANGGSNNGSLAVTAGGVVYTDGSKLVNVGAGTSGYILQSNGASAPSWVANPNSTFLGVRAYRSTAQTINSASTDTLIFATESYDTDSIYNNTTGETTIGTTAYYKIGSAILIDIEGYAATDNLRLSIFKNGTEYSVLNRFQPGVITASQYVSMMGSDTLSLASSDVITIRLTNNKGDSVSLIADATYNYFYLYKV